MRVTVLWSRRHAESAPPSMVSVFVNPTQFNDKNDLRNYPRTPEADRALLEAAGADYVFMPSVEEMYPQPDTRQFDFGMVDKVMEGATRPGHFNGVAQVVSRLFAIVEPAKRILRREGFPADSRHQGHGASSSHSPSRSSSAPSSAARTALPSRHATRCSTPRTARPHLTYMK